MEGKTGLFVRFLFLLLLILAADDEVGVKRAEGRSGKCETKSMTYKGPCVSDNNCQRVCFSEGYKGGNCHGLRRRCLCSRC